MLLQYMLLCNNITLELDIGLTIRSMLYATNKNDFFHFKRFFSTHSQDIMFLCVVMNRPGLLDN